LPKPIDRVEFVRAIDSPPSSAGPHSVVLVPEHSLVRSLSGFASLPAAANPTHALHREVDQGTEDDPEAGDDEGVHASYANRGNVCVNLVSATSLISIVVRAAMHRWQRGVRSCSTEGIERAWLTKHGQYHLDTSSWE